MILRVCDKGHAWTNLELVTCPTCGRGLLTGEQVFAPSDPIRHNAQRRPVTGFSNELEWPPVRLRAGPTRVFRLSKGTQA